MNIYRWVFLDNNAEAKAIEAIDVGDLEHAIDLAIEMLKGATSLPGRGNVARR